jgi:predicted NBD/HSP70 family sugar kinase
MKKIVTGDYRLVKKLNSQIILNLIRINAPISGAELARITKMRPSTIMNILKHLEKKGLILKLGTGNSTKLGGRKPILWEICGSYGYVLGIELELNNIQAILLDLKSQLIAKEVIKIEKFNNIQDIVSNLREIIDSILDSNRVSRRHIIGAGIGVSGLVDSKNGIIIKTSLLPASEQPIPLREALKKHFDFSIDIENDANAAAHAERWFNKIEGVSHMIFTLVIIDRNVFGVGYGLILENNLFRGQNGLAGETGPFDYNIKKILNQFCEYHQDFVTLNNVTLPIHELDIHHLIQALDSADELAVSFFKAVGKIVGEELGRIINLIDPEMIVLGGEIIKAKNYIMDPILEAINQKFPGETKRKLKLLESTLDGYSVPYGAASIILQKIFQNSMAETK